MRECWLFPARRWIFVDLDLIFKEQLIPWRGQHWLSGKQVARRIYFSFVAESASRLTSSLCAGSIGSFDFLLIGRLTLYCSAWCIASFRTKLSRLAFFSLHNQHNEVASSFMLTADSKGTEWLPFACIQVQAHDCSNDGLPYVAHEWL